MSLTSEFLDEHTFCCSSPEPMCCVNYISYHKESITIVNFSLQNGDLPLDVNVGACLSDNAMPANYQWTYCELVQL